MTHESNPQLYVLSGRVVHGQAKGRTVGMPTANLSIGPGETLPPFGVYAVWAVVDGQKYRGVTNVGLRPTVTDAGLPTVETYLMDFDGDLCGRDMTLYFCAFLRPTRKMASLREVEQQVEQDLLDARRLLIPSADAPEPVE